ncbi:MAG TPA: hypothetical protein DCQ26_04380 [Marinilabiliales bacterium]|jgi:PAS domain S-box-containing protein|nr:MAG: hypothetical protein A2W95_03065 [Bacteroidetes bacterium GWA2_40_14]OFX61081.1 MAG: hypothetical protein A2W84_09550 [Bacteroidetes bacterium GWC2_40_13]OFX72684.1 MAG: hypothetical protein A2W96_18250 [Bacteroidetes bacterium GWD2_40_43]OFX91314.1 MAG: hypothetical protein A2W97_03670 [Bacteroidetes bacterium GWE2_40_63]OFY19384.1 MAG: hypothetical protein A2W88_01550 [Bacteroidetes bacterium GWF2_40_13]OFZ26035.1 MAG: hypothetical protein A2437_10670 [Bacteroidetes bacterium RIFOXYC
MKDAILYIDDENFNLTGFSAVFGKDFEIFTALSTAQSEDILAHHEIKVIISDQRMPGENGLNFFKRIRSSYPDQVFIILTGFVETDLVIETINHGDIFRFVIKPWDKTELEHAIKMAIKTYDLKKQNQILIKNLEEKNRELEIRNQDLITYSKALSNSEQMLKQAQRVTKIGHYTFNFQTDIWTSSESLDQVFGIGKEFSRTAKGWIQVVHPEFQNIMADYLANWVIGQKQRFDKVYKIKSIDTKTDKWVHGMGDLSFDDNGNLLELFGTIQDITEQVLAQEALKASELKFSTIFKSINDAIFVHPILETGYGKILEVNEVACKKYGYTREEFLQLTIADITVDPEIERMGIPSFSKELLTGGHVIFETVNKTKDGAELAVEINASIEKINNQEVIVAVVRDITERKKVQQELAESEAKFRQFFNKSSDAIFIANIETGLIVDANETAGKLMEMEVNEIIGLHQSQLHPDANNQTASELFKYHTNRILLNQMIPLTPLSLKTKSLKEIPVEIKSSAVTLNGQVLIMGIFRDISEREQSEKRLIESESKYKAAFKTSPDAIIITDYQGKLVDVNDGFVNTTQYAIEDVLGKTVMELGLWKELDERKILYSELDRLGEINNFEARFVRKDGLLMYGLVSAKTIELNGIKHILTIVRDITARKKLEQMIMDNEQLLNTVFESAPYIIAILDANQRVVKTNLKNSDLIKKNFPIENSEKLGYVLNCASLCKNLDRKTRNGHCSNCEILDIYEFTLSTGQPVLKRKVELQSIENGHPEKKYFLISTNSIRWNTENLVLVTFDDITEQKYIEEQLIISKEKAIYNEKRYSLLSNLTFEGIVIHQNGKILDVNKSFLKLTGYSSQEELVGKNLLKTVFPLEYHSLVLTKMKQEYTEPYENVLLKKDGTLVSVEIEARNFKQQNKTMRVVAFRDLSERKQTEKMILQAIIKTEEQDKERFAQELHDGLGPILSNVQMYFQWLADEDENKEFVLEKGLYTLKNAFHTLREISNNLSPHILHDFGLIKALHWFVDQIPQQTNLIVNITSNMSNERFENSIEVALYRVITELLNNTLKYAKANNLIIHLEKRDDRIMVYYKDDGIGLDIAKALKLQKGHGLANMMNRIRTLNGKFIPSSNPNEGLLVHISIPL